MELGPYMIKEWVKGEKMVFEANPYYYQRRTQDPELRHLHRHRLRTLKRNSSPARWICSAPRPWPA